MEGKGEWEEKVFVKGYHSYRAISDRRVIYVPSHASLFEVYGFVMYGLRLFYSEGFGDGVLLHASGVVGEGGAILFVSPSGGGKSHALRVALSKGFRYIGEDMVIIRGGEVFMHPPFTVRVNEFSSRALLRRICFIRYSPGAYPITFKITNEKGLLLSMKQTFNLKRVFEQFPHHIPNSVEFLISMYSDFSEVADRCLY